MITAPSVAVVPVVAPALTYHWDRIVWVVLILALVLMQWFKKFPKAQSVQEVLTSLNSRGGNIAILTVLSIYFFRTSMVLFYQMLAQIQEGTLSQDNAIALMAIQFVTSSAFGGVMGALLKTMTGESSKARSTDPGMPTSMTSTTSTTSTTATTPLNPTDHTSPPNIAQRDQVG